VTTEPGETHYLNLAPEYFLCLREFMLIVGCKYEFHNTD